MLEGKKLGKNFLFVVKCGYYWRNPIPVLSLQQNIFGFLEGKINKRKLIAMATVASVTNLKTMQLNSLKKFEKPIRKTS